MKFDLRSHICKRIIGIVEVIIFLLLATIRDDIETRSKSQRYTCVDNSWKQ